MLPDRTEREPSAIPPDPTDQLFQPCRIGLTRWQLLDHCEAAALGNDGRAGLGVHRQLLVGLPDQPHAALVPAWQIIKASRVGNHGAFSPVEETSSAARKARTFALGGCGLPSVRFERKTLPLLTSLDRLGIHPKVRSATPSSA